MLGKRRRVIHFHLTRDEAAWQESEHPRKGTGPGGGEFTTAGGGSAGGKAASSAPGLHVHVHAPASQSKTEPARPSGGPSFNAKAYAAAHDDPAVTPDTIKAALKPEWRKEIADIDAKARRPMTIEKYRSKDGVYSAARKKLHDDILFHGVWGADPKNYNGPKKWYPPLLGPEQVAAATPPPGQKPTFIMLGGRGGSGKGSFEGKVYDPAHSILLDADHIKHMIEEFCGWNAGEVHEESSDVLERVMEQARKRGVNVVFDATMKSSGGVMEKAQAFKDAGYRIEAHYMHLPRAIAAARSIGRYFSPATPEHPERRGRYVPPEIILENRLNEENFDKVRPLTDRWTFWDNSGAAPKLVAEGGA